MNVPPPDLRIVPLDAILLHEELDEQRSWPLVERIRADGVLLNPPVVTPLDHGDARMVALDGANRLFALRHLGYNCALVQVVHYGADSVQLSTWAHVVRGLSTDGLFEAINGLDNICMYPEDRIEAEAMLARRKAMLLMMYAGGEVYVVDGCEDIEDRSVLLLRVVNTYKALGALNRSASNDLDEVRRLFPDVTALAVFPHYHPAEVIEAARDGAHLPAGITRHIIHGRALRVGYPLCELATADSFEAKNARLAAWLHQRAADRRIRLYAEATYLFDE